MGFWCTAAREEHCSCVYSGFNHRFAESHKRGLTTRAVEKPFHYVDLYLLHSASRNAGERNRALESWGEGALVISQHGGGNNSLMAAQNAAVLEQEADELARGS